MFKVIIFILIFSKAHSNSSEIKENKENEKKSLDNFISDEFIASINDAPLTWKAKRNFPQSMGVDDIMNLFGKSQDQVPDNKGFEEINHKYDKNIIIPLNFDARKKWPKCADLIGLVRDQGKCESHWAMVPASVMSDRACIENVKKFNASYQNIMSCCSKCRLSQNGCAGGYENKVWQYWLKNGTVSGGDHQSNNGCQPYDESSYTKRDSPGCQQSCTNPSYKTPYEKDVSVGGMIYTVIADDEQIQLEIMRNGPVSATLRLFGDFIHYKEGVFVHHFAQRKGTHQIKIIGWGAERGQKYWLCVNSWGKKWGNLGGLVKIKRGTNHCGIEMVVRAGRFGNKLGKNEYFTGKGNAPKNQNSFLLVIVVFNLLLFCNLFYK